MYDLKSQAGEKTIKARKTTRYNQDQIRLYCYRPFDIRHIYTENKFLWRSVEELKNHFNFENFALVTTRILATPPFNHVFVAQNIGDNTFISGKTKERNYFFPLYLYPAKPKGQILDEKTYKIERFPNFYSEFLQSLKESLGKEPAPEDIFSYIYAVLYSPVYRKRYEEFLKIDFPRVPLPKDYKLFKALSNLGKELVDLHLLRHSSLDKTEIGFPESGTDMIEKLSYDEKTQRVYINNDQYFEVVPNEVWHYRIGSYQVMEKYLKDRKGRKLSLDEINHYMKVEKAIRLTIKIQQRIDKQIVKLF